MNFFIELHKEVIKKMLIAGVDFIIIGGYSVIFHGYHRTTGDMDIWLRPDNTNKERLLPVLEQLGFDEDEIAEVRSIDFAKHTVFSIGEEPEKIDFLTHISLVKYANASEHKIIADMDGLMIPFLHLNDLVLSKMNTGRLKDKADVEMLQKVAKAKNNKSSQAPD